MSAKLLTDKIGWKPGQRVLLLNLPAGMDSPFAGVDHIAPTPARKLSGKFDLVLAFTLDRAALELVAERILPVLVDDPKLWLAYPKKTGTIATDLNRDEGWKPIFDAGFRVVAIASVDATWSAVRFRPNHLIKSTRP